jgi:hypothetical protein
VHGQASGMKHWSFRGHDDGRSEVLKYGLALVPPACSCAIGVLHTGAIVIGTSDTLRIGAEIAGDKGW